MNSLKIIKIDTDTNNINNINSGINSKIKKLLRNKTKCKKKFYKDILSSRKRTHEIIKRKSLVNKEKYDDFNIRQYESGPIESIESMETIESWEPVKQVKPAKQVKINPNKQPVNAYNANNIEDNKNLSSINPRNPRNIEEYYKMENKMEEKKPVIQKKFKKSKKTDLDFFKNKTNKYKSHNITKYFKQIKIKLFTKGEIVRFIKVLKCLLDKNLYKEIHYYIRKLNKCQTIQVLYALKLINKKSKAPEALLKIILYNYFTSNLIIIK
tara:strand:+ start:181 stop:984 length:804 start_codon:yes stop_codon:yes gene_type:complete